MILSQEDPGTRFEPGNHKENPEEIVDDDDDDDDDNDDDDDDHNNHALIRTIKTGSSEVRNEQIQPPIPSPPTSIRNNTSLDKAPIEELKETNVPMTDVPS
ncbi:hypothetical protein Tco_0190884 [Tanacetum coccineum]